MTIPDDEEARRILEQLGDEQTKAGLAHIASTVGDFRDQLLDRGFRRKEAFKLCRDMLIALMDRIDADGGEEE